MHKMKTAIFSALAAGLAAATPAQLVINEVSVNDPEFIELLVLSDGDYQNYSVVDGFADGRIGAGGFKLTGTGYSNLRAGTIIVLWVENDASASPGPADIGGERDNSYDPDNGDWVIQVDWANGVAPYDVLADTSMNLGSGTTGTSGEAIVVGIGGDYDTVPFPTIAVVDSPTSTYYDPLNFRFGFATGPFLSHSANDIDFPLGNNLNIAANGSTFAADTDYDSTTAFSPALGNTPDNIAFINGLRGVAGDDPDLFTDVLQVEFPLTAPNSTNTIQIAVQNIGGSANLDIAGSVLGGPDAGLFSITSQPTGIAPAGTGNIEVQFNPGTATGGFTATLTINSNDQSGDTFDVTLYAVSATMSDYDGLFIEEIHTATTADEFVEIVNTSASSMDIGGVILTDEDNNSTEGAVKFPAGTTLAAGERLVVALGTSADEPSWLDTVPAGIQVFHEVARDASLWTAANGNSLTAMEEFDLTTGGTNGTVFLAGDDNVALMVPGAFFIPGFGPVHPTVTIDGVNLGTDSTTAPGPINPSGDFDTPATRAASAAGDTESVVRTVFATNTSSIAFFGLSTLFSPGADTPLAADNNWSMYE